MLCCPQIVGFDISCQVGTVSMVVPSAIALLGNTYAASASSPALELHASGSRSNIDLDLTATLINQRPRLQSLITAATAGMLLVVLFGAHWLYYCT